MTTVLEIADEYFSSHDFKNLRDETKASYQYFLRVAFETEVDGTSLGSLNHASITTKQAKLVYDLWCDRGIPFANHIMATIRILYNYASVDAHPRHVKCFGVGRIYRSC